MELRTFSEKLVKDLSGTRHFVWSGKLADQKPLSSVRIDTVGVTNNHKTSLIKVVFSSLGHSHLCNGDQPFVNLRFEQGKERPEYVPTNHDDPKIARLKELALALIDEVIEGFNEPLFPCFDFKQALNNVRIPQRNEVDLELHARLISSSPEKVSFQIVEVRHIKKVGQYHGNTEYKLEFFKKGDYLYMSAVGNSDLDQKKIQRIGGIIRDKLEVANIVVGDVQEIQRVFEIDNENVYLLGLIL